MVTPESFRNKYPAFSAKKPVEGEEAVYVWNDDDINKAIEVSQNTATGSIWSSASPSLIDDAVSASSAHILITQLPNGSVPLGEEQQPNVRRVLSSSSMGDSSVTYLSSGESVRINTEGYYTSPYGIEFMKILNCLSMAGVVIV